MNMRGKPIEILLVEDNPGDVRLTQEAFQEGRIYTQLSIATDGVEAINFLRRLGSHHTAQRPDLILLDLNLPRKSGHEVLYEIKEDPGLKQIPVIILTTSNNDEDISKAYSSHANCFISKPVDLFQFMQVVTAIEDFWFTVAKLPKA